MLLFIFQELFETNVPGSAARVGCSDVPTKDDSSSGINEKTAASSVEAVAVMGGSKGSTKAASGGESTGAGDDGILCLAFLSFLCAQRSMNV